MADGMRNIAKALFNRAEEEEKRDAQAFFRSLDLNRDKKISLAEFIGGVESRIGNQRVFNELGPNRDGTLNFDDVLVLFYYNKGEITILRCRACDRLIFGPSFSCFECLRNSPKRDSLCCDCYGEGKSIRHNHPSSSSMPTQFSHDQDLLVKFTKFTPQRESKRETEGGIKSVARVYYETASEREKEEADKYFSRFHRNGDRKISLVEFNKRYNNSSNSEVPAHKMFKMLDSNKDGLLDFEDILVLFYAEERDVIRLIPCDGYCGGLLSGPYFSCISCLSKFPNTFDLCCHCYGRGDFQHHHPTTNFLHDQGLVAKLMGQPKTQLTEEMEELQNIAMLHYHATPPNVRGKAEEFFYAMDRDGDGKVNERDFMSFMRERRLDRLHDYRLFEKIDMDGDGFLGFEGVMTLYYLIKSGRPHCDWCRKFIPGVFFSCIRCFESRRSFILCRTCYQSDDCDHAPYHDGATHFLDNYTLLEFTKQSSLQHHQQQYWDEPSSSGAIVPVISGRERMQYWDEPSSSGAIVPAESGRVGMTKMDLAYKALELAISISNTVSNIAVTAGSVADWKCAIM